MQKLVGELNIAQAAVMGRAGIAALRPLRDLAMIGEASLINRRATECKLPSSRAT